jgi:hypothetical protein
MADGVSERARIDTETVRALLLANGGGAVALLAALIPALDRSGLDPLTHAILIGIFMMVLGVAFALAHNHLRARCSLVHERHNMNPPKERLFGVVPLWAPAVCCASAVCMWLSVATFVGAGGYVAWSGIATLSELQAQKAGPRPAPAGDPRVKGKLK